MKSTTNSKEKITKTNDDIIDLTNENSSLNSDRPKGLPTATKSQVRVRLLEDRLKAPSLVQKKETQSK